jgi:steroid delta-isomerase-like uncharacterized protein
MTRPEIETLAKRWLALWQGGDLADFDAIHAEHFIDHSPAGRGTDRAAFRAGIAALYEAFPDFHAALTLLAIDEPQQFATLHWTATGRHAAPFLDHAPSHRVIHVTGIEIIACRSHQITARWGEWNEPAILQQLDGPIR